MRLAILTHALSATAIAFLAFSGSAFAQQSVINFTFNMVPTDGVESCVPATGRVTITHTPQLVETMHVEVSRPKRQRHQTEPRPQKLTS